ncbi:ATP-dependent RecD-like DNA helicase (plasmid) [Paenibacillus thiaminolyticus]|uniref:helix-hairpin-helix domain-containing protein n=1 Tax=Paenibacillus thiaminolyticus TaxID=49283 RepID=UPI00232B52DE|nr:helix-hairpin-helix domain-containing protein [Paenibacillus thiaminolyticus]WCF11690.1 ATP-dependent RecD-like DNA helicase [Paenibacillus thiaminolyticus]
MTSFSSWFNDEASFGNSFYNKTKWLEELDVNDEVKGEFIINNRIVHLEDTSYSVYVCEDEDGCNFKLTGIFPLSLIEGQTYFIKGKVGVYRKEKQVVCHSARLEKPTSRHGVISFLKTLKGLNKRAEKLYDLYGSEIVEILINDPLKIAKEVSGIGKKSVESWSEQLQVLQEDYRILSALLTLGLSMKQAKQLMEKYKGFIVQMIEENPYFLADEVKGFGFKKCDEIARQIGYDPMSKNRIQLGLLYVLEESMNEGHCFLPKGDLIKRAKDCLDFRLTAIEMKELVAKHQGKTEFEYSFGDKSYIVLYQTLWSHWNNYQREKRTREKEKFRFRVIELSEEEIEQELFNLEASSRIVIDEDAVYMGYVHHAEVKVAEKILRLLLSDQEEFHGVDEDIASYLKAEGLSLEEMQRKAVYEFTQKTGGMYILNGSAGCGKTFTLNVILAVMEQQFKKNKKPFRVKIFAPTGKASKVAKKATNRGASTVHRGLGFKPGYGFEYDEDNPLEADCVVLDESSMLDILLAKNLFDAIPVGCKVIFMGDTKQLPSVGAGNVLHDLIHSGVIPVITLNVVKRQSENSGIIRNANKIIAGEMISSCKDTEDAYVIRKQTPFDVQTTIIRSIERLMEGKDYTFDDLQVLCPQKNGEVGTYVMNWVIQQAFNPNPVGEKVLNRKIKKRNPVNQEQIEEVPLYFQAGDKVIHIANNYQMPWYQKVSTGSYVEDGDLIGITNGEIGIIEEIRKEKVMNTTQTIMIVKYEDGYVMYHDIFEELDHAYAMTIHKSQGSQWPAVLIPIMMENFNMLDNSIFYTGYTRSKEFNCIIGQSEAIAHAIRTKKNRQRNTSLEKHFAA